MRNVLISLLLLTFLVGCQTPSKVIVKEEPKEVEEMGTDTKTVKIKLNESTKIDDLEISFTEHLEVHGEKEIWRAIFDLTLKKEDRNKNITFSLKHDVKNPFIIWEGYKITFVNCVLDEIELKIEKELENKK